MCLINYAICHEGLWGWRYSFIVLHHGSRWRWAVSFRLQPLTSRGSPHPVSMGVKGFQDPTRVWKLWRSENILSLAGTKSQSSSPSLYLREISQWQYLDKNQVHWSVPIKHGNRSATCQHDGTVSTLLLLLLLLLRTPMFLVNNSLLYTKHCRRAVA
jgi:hypothetical protein